MNNWTNNPKLNGFDKNKLEILSSMAKEGVFKNQNEMLPFFLSALNSAHSKGIDFSPEEKSVLLDVLMEQLSPAEKKKAETIIRMTSAFKK